MQDRRTGSSTSVAREALAEDCLSTSATPSRGAPRVPDRRVVEFQRRLAHIDESFRRARNFERGRPTYNEGLRILAKALNPRARRSENSVRLHPALELLIKARWLQRNAGEGGNSVDREPTPSDIWDICEELRDKLKPVRGRPADPNLTYHVRGLMALIQDTCGEPAQATRFKDSVYDPQMTSAGGRVVDLFFRNIDPAITTTALANIICQTHASGAIRGKHFRDFFPFYGGHIDRETGFPVPGPGYRLERFDPVFPIYCR